MSRRCLVCRGRAPWRHHPTGRDDQGAYLDPDLKSPVCHDDHQLAHDDWKTLGLEEVEDRLTVFERVELRHRRLAPFLARIAEANDADNLNAQLARHLCTWADELTAGVRCLDEGYAAWRSDPAFYPTGPDPETP